MKTTHSCEFVLTETRPVNASC